MDNNVQTPMEAFFPDRRIYEYFLQRLRLVASKQTRTLRVHDIRDVPDATDDLPCIEVVLRIPGLKIYNPATGKQMISTDWLRKHFQGPVSQQGYLNALAEYLDESIPIGDPEAHLKPKFKHVRDGAPGHLPARADLYVWHDELVRHLVAAKKWLRRRKQLHQGFSEEDQAAFLEAISHPIFWWAKYVKQGHMTVEQIARYSPKATAIEILALKFGVSLEAIKSRFRREV